MVVVVVVVVGEAGGQDGAKMHALLGHETKLPRLYGITVWDLRPLLSCCWGYSLGLFPCWVLGGQSCQAKTWQELKASNAPSKTVGHTAVMDAQQRMWIFGGCAPRVKSLYFVCV